ncbi:MAG: aminoacyl-tRNA hydrolase [Planctomycetota bacterium]
MKLIVGLGNPGSEYEHTRHNAGFMVLDRLVRRLDASAGGGIWRGQFQGLCQSGDLSPGVRVVLLKPTTYMNRSGQSVAEAVRFYKLDPGEDLIVITDDIALPVGSIRARPGGGDGGHNGLKSVTHLLGTDQYPRLRFGVDAVRTAGENANQVDYVLGRFTDAQRDLVEPAIEHAADLCVCFAEQDLSEAMNRFNTKKQKKPRAAEPAATEDDSEIHDAGGAEAAA